MDSRVRVRFDTSVFVEDDPYTLYKLKPGTVVKGH